VSKHLEHPEYLVITMVMMMIFYILLIEDKKSKEAMATVKK